MFIGQKFPPWRGVVAKRIASLLTELVKYALQKGYV
jgi:hypothetical protein